MGNGRFNVANIKENFLEYIQIYQQSPIKLITLILDLAIVLFLAYNLLKIAKDSRAWQLIKGIALLVIATWLSGILNLNILNYILSAVMNWGVIDPLLAAHEVNSYNCSLSPWKPGLFSHPPSLATKSG